jgi:feruloyl-CoA synthase
MIFPSSRVASAQDAIEDDGALIVPSLTSELTKRLTSIGGSSSTRVARAVFLSSPPSMAEGEVTAKGSLNFKKILTLRSHVLERLYEDDDQATVLIPR